MFLLDTNVVSELRKVSTGRAEPALRAWAEKLTPHQVYVSAVTVLELELGVQLAERTDPAQGQILRQWLDEGVLRAFDQRILPVDVPVARRAAGLHVPDPAAFADALIAATALQHRLTVVSRNLRDFERFDGLRVINPWS